MKILLGSKENKLEKCFSAYLILVLYYYSYRYVLNYNSSETSPVYLDTPLVFKATKYIILGLIIFILAFGKVKIKFSSNNKLIGILMFCLCIWALLAGIITQSVTYLIFSLELLPVFFFLNCKENFAMRAERILVVFFSFSLLYELIQIVLYKTEGRLPALAYSTGVITDVRFGGTWDDPNGFSLVLSFYMPYFFSKAKGIRRVMLTGLSIMMLTLTWSLTGIFSCVCGIIMALFFLGDKRTIKRLFFCIIFILCVIISVYCIYHEKINKALIYFMSSKQESISEHISGWSLEGISVLTLVGLYPIDQFSEIGILRLVYMGGVPVLTLFVSIMIITLRKLRALIRKGREYFAFVFGSTSFIFTFFISLCNLPLIFNFSCFGVFVAFVIVAETSSSTVLCERFITEPTTFAITSEEGIY